MHRKDKEIIARVQQAAKPYFEGAPGSHGWDHTMRVYRLCRRIGPREGADMAVLSVAALLHDIGRRYQDASGGALCHAEKGAELAAVVVESLPLTPSQKENVIHCIRAHRYRGANVPETVEARVLFDADKLDAIGAVGVARAYLFAGEVGASLHNPDNRIDNTEPYSKDDTGYREFRVKLCKIKDRMLTETGKKIAETRHSFMAQFFERFVQEHEEGI